MQALPQTNGIVDTAQLLAAIQKISGLTNVGTTPDGNVTGNFSDGVPCVFFNNRGVASGGFSPSGKTAKSSTSAVLPQISERGSTSSIKLVDSEDSFFFGNRTNDDAGMFSRNGYPGTTLDLATVAAYRGLGSKPMGLLDMSGHGGIVQSAPHKGLLLGYGIWTATQAFFNKTASNYNASAYASDLKDGSLGVATAFASRDAKGNPVAECHFCFLPQFMIKY